MGMLDEDTVVSYEIHGRGQQGCSSGTCCVKDVGDFIVLIHHGNDVSGIGILWGDDGKIRILPWIFFKYGVFTGMESRGFLLGIVGIFPHYLCYVPAMLLLLRWCEDMHRSIYFYHNITGQGKKSLPGRLGRLALILVVLRLFGCVLECVCESCVIKRLPAIFLKKALPYSYSAIS